MKTSFLIAMRFLAVVVLIPTILTPCHVSAQQFYITAKPGIYSSQTSDLDGFDTSFNGELALGWQPIPNLAAEIGVGYLKGETEHFIAKSPKRPYSGELTLNVVPITFTLKAVVPYNQWELYGLGGIGVYSVSGDFKASVNDSGRNLLGYFSPRFGDQSRIYGTHWGLGFHYNVTPVAFVGAEGKYLWSSKARLEGTRLPVEAEFKIDGIFATVVIGLRF